MRIEPYGFPSLLPFLVLFFLDRFLLDVGLNYSRSSNGILVCREVVPLTRVVQQLVSYRDVIFSTFNPCHSHSSLTGFSNNLARYLFPCSRMNMIRNLGYSISRDQESEITIILGASAFEN